MTQQVQRVAEARLSRQRSARAESLYPKQKDGHGHPICSCCQSPLVKADGSPRNGNAKYCSEPCREEVYIRTNPSYARWKVQQRDQGVCSECGVDTKKVEKAWHRYRFALTNMLPRFSSWIVPLEDACRYVKGRQEHFWEMDHIVPVSEGGGVCGLDNLRTLCHWCHGEATTNLRRRLSVKASPQLQLFGTATV